MDGFELEVLNRLPLAEAVPTLFRYVANAQVLNDVFDQSRGRAYEDILSFDLLVDMVFKALLVYESGRTSFAAARDAGTLDVTDQAAFGKLRRIPAAVSEALLSTVSYRLTDLVVPSLEVRSLPACFAGYALIHIDGKKIKKLAKRLKPLEALVVRRRLTELLRGVWSDQWEKSPAKKNYKPTAKTKKVKGGHSSAWKLLETARRKKRRKARANK